MADNESGKIEGIVQLDGEPVQANLYLADLLQLPTVQSDPITGAYAFEDPGDHSIIPDSDQLIVLCHYGVNIRPLAHGPVVPEFEVIAVDPYWDNVVMLLPMDGDLTDASNTGKTPTVTGATLSTAQAKYGLDSAYFGGDGDRIVIANDGTLRFRNLDFCIDFWVRFESVSGGEILFCQRDPVDDSSENQTTIFVDATNGITFAQYGPTGSLLWSASAGGLPETDVWIFVSAVVSGTTATLYIDGSVAGSAASIMRPSDTYFQTTLGASPSGGSAFNGWLDGVRVTQGFSRYSADFALPGQPFYVGEAVGDEHWANVDLLLPMNGTNGQTTFTDVSPSPKTITRYGDAKISTAQWRFGGSAAYFDGTGDYLTATSDTFLVGTGDFTIEFWARRDASQPNAYPMLFGKESDATGSFNIFVVSAGGAVYLKADGIAGNVLLSGVLESNTWGHVAYWRRNGVIYGAFNGVVNTDTLACSVPLNASNKVVIGGATGLSPHKGYIDDVRFTVGVARYTENFTPPVRGFPNYGI